MSRGNGWEQGPRVEIPQGPGCLLRVLWFIFIGSWLSQLWIILTYIVAVTVIGLPVALLMLNMLPLLATLRPATRVGQYRTRGGGAPAPTFMVTGVPQRSFWLRALYFIFVGWWFVFIWLELAWLLLWLIVTIPISMWMIDRAPAVTTLRRY